MSINTILNKIEASHNRLADLNAIWFPFVFLKPSPQEYLSWKRIIVMSLSFGFYYAIARILKSLITNASLTAQDSIEWLFEGSLYFLIWFSLVTRFFWNRRARRLLASEEN